MTGEPAAPEDPLIDEDLGGTPPLWKRILNNWVGPLLLFVVLFQAVGYLRAPSLPEQAPGFSLRTPEGDVITLEQFRGQTVVLNFWATWCGPCRLEAPSFDTFATNNPDIAVLGLAQDPKPALVRASAKKLGIHYPVLLADRETLEAYSVTTFPTTVIVDAEGNVSTAHTGLLTRPQLWMLTRF